MPQQKNTGGLLVGYTDKGNGKGIRVQTPEGNILVGGGEIVLTENTSKSKVKHKFDGRELTACEIASELNQEGGGVYIPCDEVSTANKGYGNRLTVGGKIPNNFYISDTSSIIDFDTIIDAYNYAINGNRSKTNVGSVLLEWEGYLKYPNAKNVSIEFIFEDGYDVDFFAGYSKNNNLIIINFKKFKDEYSKYKITTPDTAGRENSERNIQGESTFICRLFFRKLFHELQHYIQYIEGMRLPPTRKSDIVHRLKVKNNKLFMEDVFFLQWLKRTYKEKSSYIIYNEYKSIPEEKQALEQEMLIKNYLEKINFTYTKK